MYLYNLKKRERGCIIGQDDDDDVYLKKITTRGVTKYNPTQKCRPAKGISKRDNIQIIEDAEITEQPNNK
jgi:hypothetical protein